MNFDENTLYNIKTSLPGMRRPLFDLAIWKNGLAFKKINFSEEGVPVIKIAELNNGIGSNTSFTKGDYGEEVRLHRGDLLFSWSGNPQTSIDVYKYKLDDGWLNQHIFKVTANETMVSKDFLFYLLKYLKPHFTQIATNKQTTGLGHVTIADLKRMSIVAPEKKVQEGIVAIVKTIDDKIEVNNEINKNLQQQVQAIFSDWLAKHIEDSDEVSLGEICAKVTDGSHFSPKDDPTSTIPMLSVKDMGEFDFSLTSCKHISEVDYQKMIANDCVPQINDILVAKDGSYLKEIFICNEERQLAILSSIAIFRPDTLKIYPEILLAFLKSPRVLQEVRDNYVSGSALPRIVLKDFKKLRFLLPNIAAQSEISELLSSIRLQIAVNEAESNQLAQLRDALLLKLMSGELDVSGIQI